MCDRNTDIFDATAIALDAGTLLLVSIFRNAGRGIFAVDEEESAISIQFDRLESAEARGGRAQSVSYEFDL